MCFTFLKSYKWSYIAKSNPFASNSRLKFGKKLAKAKQHPEAERLFFHPRFYQLFAFFIHVFVILLVAIEKNNRAFRKKCAKSKCASDIWLFLLKMQKPPSEVFYKKACSLKYRKIHSKTPLPESLFNKAAGLRPSTILKKKLWHRCFAVNFAEFWRIPFL